MAAIIVAEGYSKGMVGLVGTGLFITYGLGQIFPRYIEPCQIFMEKIKENRNQGLEDDEIKIVIKNKSPKIKINFNIKNL